MSPHTPGPHEREAERTAIRPNTSDVLPLDQYDRIIVSFSGGKDSTACVLSLLERGVSPQKIELWHQAVDGRGESRERLMDWPVTESYCAAVAAALGVPLYFQWREGGFVREMLRAHTPTAPVRFESADALGRAGGHGPPGTRGKFPQVSADLRVRWCSAYLKIDVARRTLTNDARFASGAFLFVTGERRQESMARARYAAVERHPCTNASRRVDHWRMVIDWSEEQVWDMLRRWRIRPHPAYFLGWGRVSCALCIFGDPDQWASARALLPTQFTRIAQYEARFGVTIQRGRDVNALAEAGQSFLPDDEALKRLALSECYPKDMARVSEDDKWVLPIGAFKRAGGPT